MSFTDNFERSDRDLNGDLGWKTIPPFEIIDGAAVCAPSSGGVYGARRYLLRSAGSGVGTYTISSHLPDPIVLFPGDVWPRFFLMGVVRYQPLTGYGVFYFIEWDFDDTLAYLDTYVRVFTRSSAGELEVTLSGGGSFPSKVAGDPAAVSFDLDSSGNVTLTSDSISRTGVIDAGAWAELPGGEEGISTDAGYEALPVESFSSTGEGTDDFERADQILDTALPWYVSPLIGIDDGKATLLSSFPYVGNLLLVRDAGEANHWEWHGIIPDPPAGYPGQVQFFGIVRCTDSITNLQVSDIEITVLLFYNDATTLVAASGWVSVYAVDGDTPIASSFDTFTALPGDPLDVVLDIYDAGEMKLTVNSVEYPGTTASDLDTNVPGTYAGFAWTGIPFESISMEPEAPPPPEEAALVSITVRPNTPQNLYVGDIFKFTVYALYDDDSLVDVSDQVTWPSGAPVGTFDGNGNLTVTTIGELTGAEVAWTVESVLYTADIPDITTIYDTRLTIDDEKSTAPHGMYFECKILSDVESLTLSDPDDDTWAFQIVKTDGFEVDDILVGSSDYNNKFLYLIRGEETISIVDAIVPGSVWPLMFPGKNKLRWDPTFVTWEKVWYYPTYWGV